MFIIIDDEGMIVQTASPVDEENYGKTLAAAGKRFIEIGADPARFYAPNGSLQPRPILATSLSKDTVKAGKRTYLRGVPKGARISIDGPHSDGFTHDDEGDITLTFGLSGEYTIHVDAPPAQLSILKVTVE